MFLTWLNAPRGTTGLAGRQIGIEIGTEIGSPAGTDRLSGSPTFWASLSSAVRPRAAGPYEPRSRWAARMLAKFTQRVEALRNEQRRREQQLDQPADQAAPPTPPSTV
jgi:hypothetical protein